MTGSTRLIPDVANQPGSMDEQGWSGADIQLSVISPPDIGEYELVRDPEEDDEHYEFRRILIAAILDNSGS